LDSRRADVVTEALSWIGTPYRLNGQAKGAGCDCATLLLCVFRACGVFDEQIVEQHFQDWYCHTKEERYLRWLLKHAAPILRDVAYKSTKIEPGNIVSTKAMSDKYNHAGIVIAWPKIVHCVRPSVRECDATKDHMWAFHEISVFDPFVK
jgi:cell wall-associated NlpC family hydrolase